MQLTASANTLFELLRAGLHPERAVKVEWLEAPDWAAVYRLATEQGVAAIAWDGVVALRNAGQIPPSMEMPRTLKLQWAMQVEQIEKRYEKADQAVAKVFGALKRDGIQGVLLKGQGISRLYPSPKSRMSGDIDVWILAERKDAIDYVRREKPLCRPVYHHVDAVVGGVNSVEIHFFPTWMYDFITNRRLQCFFAETADEQFTPSRSVCIAGESIPVPTATFNSIYILIHLYRHLFDEGIGVRQLLDYYCVLNNRSEIEIATFSLWIRLLRLTRFAGAIAYILHRWLDMPKDRLPIEPNEVLGRQLMEEILSSGNFGKFGLGGALACQPNRIMRAWMKMRRNMTFAYAYPSEVFAAPFFKLWHYLWRKSQGWI